MNALAPISREAALMGALDSDPVSTTVAAQRSGIDYPSAYQVLCRLAGQGRVRKIGGGRNLPHGQKACAWALPAKDR